MSHNKAKRQAQEIERYRQLYNAVCVERDHWKVRAQMAEAHYIEAIETIGALQVKRCEDIACERRRK